MARSNTMRKVSMRNVLAHKTRLALTLLAVVLGTAFIAGSFMFTNSLSNTFDSAVTNAFSGVDAAVSPAEGQPGVSKETREAIENDDKVGGVNVNSQQTVVLANEDAEAYQPQGGSASISPFYQGDQKVGEPDEITDGEAPHEANQVVLNEDAAEKFDIHIGDKVLVVHPDSRETATVTGTFKSALDQAEAPGTIRLGMDPDKDLERYHPDGMTESLAVAAAEGEDPQALVDHLNDTYDVKAETGEKIADDMSETITSALKFVNYFFVAFGLIALLVGTFIIANTFSMIVAQRTKEFALLRALGASRNQITRSVIGESIIVGIIGSLVGVLAGVGLVAAIKAIMRGQGMPMDNGLGLSPTAVLVPVLLGTVVTVVSALAPSLRAGAVEPVEAMRSTETASATSLKGRTIAGVILLVLGVGIGLAGALLDDASTTNRAICIGVGALLIIVGYFLAGPAFTIPVVPALGRAVGAPFGAVGRLAATNSRRNPRRTAATAFALTLGITLVTTIGMLGATMKSSVQDTMDRNVAADFILTGPRSGNFPTPADTAEKAREAEGVDKVLAVSTAPVTVDGAGSYGMASMVMDDNPDALVELDMVDGSADLKGEGGFLASKKVADEHGWKVGESYPLESAMQMAGAQPGGAQPDGAQPGGGQPGGEEKTVKLTGVFEDNNVIQNLVVSKDVVKDVVPDKAINLTMVGVTGKEGVSDDDLRANLEKAVKDLVVVQVISADEFASDAASSIDMMLNILYALLALAVIVAVLGIINTLTLGVIERRQEIGMLRAVGTQRRQIRTMITLEAIQVAVFGAIMGILLGLALGWAFIRVLSSEGLDSMQIPWTLLAVMLVGSGIVGIVAAVWPSGRAAKTPPLDAIQD